MERSIPRGLARITLISGLVATLALLPADLAAEEPEPVGSEFQVNSYTTSAQLDASVSSDATGDFVVVWRSDGSSGTDSSGYSIQGQRYASDGTPQGGQFQVNSYTTSAQFYPSVSSDADGDFVVVWESGGSSGTDSSNSSVQGQRYASDGTLRGGQFQVNSYTTGYQIKASVSSDADGDFVVVWESYGSYGTDSSLTGVQGQRYASDGTPKGGQFQVNTYTTNFQTRPSVSSDAGGDFVVVWTSGGSYGTDSSGYSIQGQRYASDGTPQGGEFQVNSYTTGFQLDPSVSSDAGGNFVVAWQSAGSYGTDGSGFSIQGQRYASDGTPQGGQFQVNSYTTSTQLFPSASSDADGDFVVVWQSDGSSDSDSSGYSIQGQRYASDGTPQGGQFQVNTFTTSHQRLRTASPDAVSSAANGDFVVVWESDGSYGTDTSGYSIQGQRFDVVCTAPDGENLVLSDDTVTGAEVYEVCDTITTGPNYDVAGPNGDLTLRAGDSVILGNGTSVGTDGRLTIELDPSL